MMEYRNCSGPKEVKFLTCVHSGHLIGHMAQQVHRSFVQLVTSEPVAEKAKVRPAVCRRDVIVQLIPFTVAVRVSNLLDM